MTNIIRIRTLRMLLPLFFLETKTHSGPQNATVNYSPGVFYARHFSVKIYGKKKKKRRKKMSFFRLLNFLSAGS